MDSDTDVMVLSFVPSRRETPSSVTIQAADAVRQHRRADWRARSGCSSTAGSIRTSRATSKAWTSSLRNGAFRRLEVLHPVGARRPGLFPA